MSRANTGRRKAAHDPKTGSRHNVRPRHLSSYIELCFPGNIFPVMILSIWITSFSSFRFGLSTILEQDAHHPACIERQHDFQIINAELYTRDSVPRKFRQIDGHRFHEHPLYLNPTPGIYKLLKLRPVLPHKVI